MFISRLPYEARLVSYRHLTETAEIVHARAIDFVFKPHGDAGDSDSIILTREQYRQLLPQGERQNALESVKMLLASRPVVYLGFGLRDPDFIYVRDLLANTYKGGIRDHYAIMADVSDAERDYWRRNYGIHLVSYTTTEHPKGARDHTALLTLLDALVEPIPPVLASVPTLSDPEPCSPDLILSLARHAARLTRSPKLNPEFKIRVHTEAKDYGRRGVHYESDKFDHYPVEKFLDNGPARALLIGLPGTGKTYSLRRAAARLADKLYEACLSEPFDEKTVIVPILADLKLYRGDLTELVSQTLPQSLSFDEMTQRFKLRIFLDSFNEMPREYWESGSYESDFAKFTASIGNASLVIGSRTNDGLSKLRLPVYSLDQIDNADLDAELHRLSIEIEGRFEREVRSLLQKPFYFQLIASGRVSLPKEAHPRDFYQSFFENLSHAFETRFGKTFDIEKALSLTAYDAINRGEEAYPLADFLRILRTSFESVGLAEIDVHDVANWLVSTSVLIPHTGGRVAFVHQSVTEFLAASELARRYQASPYILKEKLSFTRWDQALFLALSLLPSPHAEAFLQDVIKADFALALNAAKYLEVGRDEIVTRLLSEIPGQLRVLGDFHRRIEWAVEFSLPITGAHEPQLRMLMNCGDSIGEAAVKRLVALKGAAIKDELLPVLVEARDDYNYCCNGIASALKPFATFDDIEKVVVLADSIQDEVTPDSDEDVAQGFISGAADFLAGLDIAAIRDCFLPQDKSERIQEVRARILCNILWDHQTTDALNLAGELLLRGVSDAEVAICFIANHGKPDSELLWSSFTADHVDRLETIILNVDRSWGVTALQYLCCARPDLADLVKRRSEGKTGLAKAALLYCVSPADLTPLWTAFNELVKMDDEQRREEPIHFLSQIEIDWAENENLFVQLLKLRDAKLASALLGDGIPYMNSSLGKLEIGQIEWWMEWMMELNDQERGDVFGLQLGGLFGGYLRPCSKIS